MVSACQIERGTALVVASAGVRSRGEQHGSDFAQFQTLGIERLGDESAAMPEEKIP